MRFGIGIGRGFAYDRMVVDARISFPTKYVNCAPGLL
jgi:hypothetical protein